MRATLLAAAFGLVAAKTTWEQLQVIPTFVVDFVSSAEFARIPNVIESILPSCRPSLRTATMTGAQKASGEPVDIYF